MEEAGKNARAPSSSEQAEDQHPQALSIKKKGQDQLQLVCIVGAQRTGTTALGGLLLANEQVAVDGEVLLEAPLDGGASLAWIKACAEDFSDAFFQANGFKPQCYVFHLKYGQILERKGLVDLLRQEGVRILHTYRDDVTGIAISQYFLRTGRIPAHSGMRQMTNYEVGDAEIDEIQLCAKEFVEQEALVSALLDGFYKEGRCFDVSFEELLAEDHPDGYSPDLLRGIFKFLDLPMRHARLGTVSTLGSEASGRISNFGRIEKRCRSSQTGRTRLLQAAPTPSPTVDRCRFCGGELGQLSLAGRDLSGRERLIFGCRQCDAFTPDWALGLSWKKLSERDPALSATYPTARERLALAGQGKVMVECFSMLTKLVPNLPPWSGARILELAAGVGKNSFALRELGGNVTAVERPSKSLELYRSTFDLSDRDYVSACPEVHLQLLRKQHRKFDYVVIWNSLSRIENISEALVGCGEVLASGGHLIIQDSMPSSRNFRINQNVLMTWNSASYISSLTGLSLRWRNVDHGNDFITMIFARPATGVN